jgi:hypothetical protein
MTTVSAIIGKRNIAKIDLLKINAPKAERLVLEGIDEIDWPKISQVVLEVRDSDGALAQIGALLTSKGFDWIVEQDPLHIGTSLFRLYASRADVKSPLQGGRRTQMS